MLEASPVDCLEGHIEATGPREPGYRVVTNAQSAGRAFMTANLFVRAEAFRRTAGFDVSFDDPSFREDTDLGWRLAEVGSAATSRDVIVEHPSEVERPADDRSRFFVRDAQLYAKHPSRFVELIRLEAHVASNPRYIDLFFEGRATARHPDRVRASRPVREPACGTTRRPRDGQGSDAASRQDAERQRTAPMTRPTGALTGRETSLLFSGSLSACRS